MPKKPERIARDRRRALEARFDYPWPTGPSRQGWEAWLRREMDRRAREQRLALRIEKPTSTAHFVEGRYLHQPFSSRFDCKDCGAEVTDRWQHDRHHATSTPGAGVIMFLETLEALFGDEP
jgi:hypothetical protein